MDFDVNIKSLIEIVEQKQYFYGATKFRSIVDNILKSGNKDIVKEQLDKFIEEAIPEFYKGQLAIFVLSIYEKFFNDKTGKENAIKIATKIIEYSNKTSYAFAALLRICKNKKNFKEIDELFQRQPDIRSLQTFEVMYELIFYYESKNDTNQIESLIGKMINRFKGAENKSILNTAKALAIKYGLLEKFERDFIIKSEIKISTEPIDIRKQIIEQEYENMLKGYERALSSAALADLTHGIAHEFGQPITNIRFGIQYYTKIFSQQDTKQIDRQIVLECFNDILYQTERIGDLINRLSPITSTKSHISNFNIITSIQDIFNQEHKKLVTYNINYKIETPKSNCIISFDKVQFNQIISNLLLNSIDSISEKKQLETINNGLIIVKVVEHKTNYTITFEDNGKGITEKDRIRIFNPFYTTKEPGKGQGLGLYIVKNLLKIYSSSIALDNRYFNGARFIINIPKRKHV